MYVSVFGSVLSGMFDERLGCYISSVVALRPTVPCFTSGRYHMLSFLRKASLIASARILGSFEEKNIVSNNSFIISFTPRFDHGCTWHSQVIKPTHHHKETKTIESSIDMVAGSNGAEVDQRRAVIFGRPLDDSNVALISTSGLILPPSMVGLDK